MNLRKKVVDTFWNSMGSGIFAVASLMLLLCVTREYGVSKAGSFGVAITTAQLLYRVGIFAMRQYQITDLNNEFSFATYFSVKIVTTMLSFLLFSIYIIVDSATKNEFWQFLWIFLFYQLLSVDDLFQNRLFQENRLDKAGRSKCFVIGGYLGFFLILLYFKLELTIILAGSFLASLIISIMNCPRYIREEMIFLWDRSIIYAIKMALPAFVSNFLLAFINSLPKYTVYYFCSRVESGYVNNIFMFLNLIELAGSFIYYPFIPDITRNMTEDPRKVHKLILRLSLVTLTFSCIIAIILHFVGKHILNLIYQRDFTIYMHEIIYTVCICGVFVAFIGLLYWIPVILREQKQLIIIFTSGTIIALAGCVGGTLKFGVQGAIAGHSFATGLMTVLLLRFFSHVTDSKGMNKKSI